MCSVTEGGQGRNSKEEPGSRDKSRDRAAVWLASTLTFKCLAFTSGPKGPVAACPQWVGPSHITQQSRNCPLNMLTGRMIEKKKSHLRFPLPRWLFLESSWTKPNQHVSWPEVYGWVPGLLIPLCVYVCTNVWVCEYVCVYFYVCRLEANFQVIL